MNEDLVMQLGHQALATTAMVAAPMLLGALIIGLLVSVFQAITQINEATLTFIPKMVVVGIVIMIAGPWIMDVLSSYATELFGNLHMYVRH